MVTYFADANIFLRFILKDNEVLAKKSRNYFTQAKARKIIILVLSEIVLEIEYVLRKVYSIPRKEIASQLSDLINASYFKIDERSIYDQAMRIYQDTTVDLVDIFLLLKAKEKNAQVLSYDKDFDKLDKMLKTQTG